MGFGKANILGFNSRNMIKWPIESLLRFQYLLNLLYLCKMWHLVSIGYCLQGQLNSSLGKNQSLYSLIGVWLVIALDALVHNELKWPKYLSHEPPLIYNSSIVLSLLSTRLRKCLPFISDVWNVIFHLFTRSSHLFFLLKSQDDLLGKSRMRPNDFISTATTLWRDHLHWLEHSQNSIEFFQWWEKNTQSLLRIAAECFWNGWEVRSKIFLAIWIESVTTMILEMSLRLVAWLILHLMVNSSASVLVMFIAWWSILTIGLLWIWMCEMEVAILFLMLASMITSTLDGVLEDSRAKLSSCWLYNLRFWLLYLLNKQKEKQLLKMSIILWPGENSGFRGSNEGNTSLYQLSISTMWSLMHSYCHLVKKLSDKVCCIDSGFGLIVTAVICLFIN